MNHNRRILIVTAAALAALAAPLLWTGRAHAAVIPVRPLPLAVTVSGPSARIDLDVVSTAPMFRDGGHGVVLRTGSVALYGTGAGDNDSGTALVHIGAQIASQRLTAGTTTATLTDLGDGGTTGIRLTVLRHSHVILNPVLPLPGAVLVMGRASHYDLVTGVYRGDTSSPVLVQTLTAGKWTTLATTTTAPDGSVAAAVAVSPGRHLIRLVRPAGATVTGAASPARVATVQAV